jgi:hypothetical protein
VHGERTAVSNALSLAANVSYNGRMISHRITKYDPSKRNSDGSYNDHSAWTSISDIGKAKYGSPSYEDYRSSEDGYVNAVLAILESNGLSDLRVEDLELYDTAEDFEKHEETGRLRGIAVDFDKEVKTLRNGAVVGKEAIKKIVRLILRETIWMRLMSEKVEVKFGYDYYMYVKCSKLSDELIAAIEAKGVFVEPTIDQRQIIVVDKDGNEV